MDPKSTPYNDYEQPADALALLQADHQRLSDLFALYAATEKVETKFGLAYQIFRALETHAQLEENVLYPAVHEETDEGPELVKASLEAHQTMKQLMQELRSMAYNTDAFDAKFHELMHNVERHVAEEEAAMFPLAREALADDLDALMEEMQMLKADLQGS